MRTTHQYGRKSDLALSLWVKLARAFWTFNRHAADDIRHYGLTQPQFAVVEALGHLGGLTLGDLSRKQRTSCSNITVIVDNLEHEGLAYRKQSEKDRRVILVNLTPEGKRLFKDTFPRHAQRITELASVLTEKDQRDLGRLLKRLGLRLQDGN